MKEKEKEKYKTSLDYWHKIGKETNSHTPFMDFLYGGKEKNPFHTPKKCKGCKRL